MEYQSHVDSSWKLIRERFPEMKRDATIEYLVCEVNRFMDGCCATHGWSHRRQRHHEEGVQNAIRVICKEGNCPVSEAYAPIVRAIAQRHILDDFSRLRRMPKNEYDYKNNIDSPKEEFMR